MRIQFLLFLPLLFVTYQVIMLRRVLRSRAWTLIMLAFLAAVVGAALNLLSPLTSVRRVMISLLVYTFLGWGLMTLRKDLTRLKDRNPRAGLLMENGLTGPGWLARFKRRRKSDG